MSTTTTTYTYAVHHLPSSDPTLHPFLAGKLASLRLSALLQSPTSFSATFATESALTPAQWLARLALPHNHIFIAAAYPPSTPSSELTITNGAWIGTVTMLGSQSLSAYTLPDSGNPLTVPGDEDAETRWHLTFVFNDPMHRRRGVAKLLLEGAVRYAQSQTPKGRGVRVRVLFPPHNEALVRGLYAGAGFVDAGRCTRAQAYGQNGDGALVPADGGVGDPETWLARIGFVMESVTVA